jgi:hypothetical protein
MSRGISRFDSISVSYLHKLLIIVDVPDSLLVGRISMKEERSLTKCISHIVVTAENHAQEANDQF